MKTQSTTQSVSSSIRLVPALAAALLLGSLVLTTAQAGDDSRTIAKSTHLQGKMREGQCLPFALDLYQRLTAAGGESYLIIYNWDDLSYAPTTAVRPSSPADQARGSHAFVVFRDAKGRYYGMDNKSWRPVWLKGETAQEWVTSFAGQQMTIQVASVETNPALHGQYADLSRGQHSEYMASR
jgi:hypothetical protein